MNAPAPLEPALRARLGVPAEAERVLIFGESSHWDTNWLQTSEGYYRTRLEPIFTAVFRELEKDPRRVYCIESVFFLKLYWERHPEQRERLRELINTRRLRLLASSFTTPDTLLPHAETVLRDFHLGQLWLDANGLLTAPTTAYFPDNFGHSPHTPSLMRALGIDAVGLTRIDGMHFIGADYRRKSGFPLSGSSAELLERTHRSLDFVWRDEGGAEVLCHWNAFTYFHGDMLAHAGIIRWMGRVFGISWRSERHIARRIERYVKQLGPLSPTPYLFCPIGMDFNDPITDLGELLARYNRVRYPHTGTWATLAGLDDYFALLEFHRAKLPVLELDPNPYWMGFYATRPEVKQRPTRIARTLLLAETLSSTAAPHPEVATALHAGWSRLILSNHHDYITGTSPDRIWIDEQQPWLEAAETAAEQALTLASEAHAFAPWSPPTLEAHPLHYELKDGELSVRTRHYRFTLSEKRGGCLTTLEVDGRELLRGLGLDLVAFHDEGGLWRLGNEYAGGRFSEWARASEGPATVDASLRGDELWVKVTSTLRGRPFTRTLVCHPDEPFFRVSVKGHAPRRCTITCRFGIALDPAALEMDTVGGVTRRPRERHYSPTFWPVPSRLTLADGPRELHALFDTPTAASFSPKGELEWIVARNAPKERAFRFLPVMAHPIGGTNDGSQDHWAALVVIDAGGDPDLLRSARVQLESAWLSSEDRPAREHAQRLVRCDAPTVRVAALKQADHGQGLILRLVTDQPAALQVHVGLEHRRVVEAFACDARERDLERLPVDTAGTVTLEMSGFLASVRLIVE